MLLTYDYLFMGIESTICRVYNLTLCPCATIGLLRFVLLPKRGNENNPFPICQSKLQPSFSLLIKPDKREWDSRTEGSVQLVFDTLKLIKYAMEYACQALSSDTFEYCPRFKATIF